MTVSIGLFFGDICWIILRVFVQAPSSLALVAFWEFRVPFFVVLTFLGVFGGFVFNFPLRLGFLRGNLFWDSMLKTFFAGVTGHIVILAVFFLKGDRQGVWFIGGNLCVFLLSGFGSGVFFYLGYLLFSCFFYIKLDSRGEKRVDWVYQGLLSFFCGSCIFANLLVVKHVLLGRAVTASLFVYSLTFVFTDVLSELYGHKKAKSVIWVGWGSIVLMLLLVDFVALFPFYQEVPDLQRSFKESFSFLNVAVFASMGAFFCCTVR